MSDRPSASMETRVAKLEGQLSQLVSTVSSFIDSSENWRGEISRSLGKLSENISEKTRPNLHTMAVWAAIVLSVIGMVSTPCAFFVIREMNRQDKVSENLDAKLQREFTLMQQNTIDRMESVNRSSQERHEVVSKRVDAMESWKSDQIRSDLDELRARRLKDVAR